MSNELAVIAHSSGDNASDSTSLSAPDAVRDMPVMSSPASTPAKRRPRQPKPPKDSKVYKIAMAVVALRAQGLRGHAVAEQLGVPKRRVYGIAVMLKR